MEVPSRFNRFTVSMMILSAVVGFLFNYWSTKLANDRLLKQLQDQYDAILQALQKSRGISYDLLEKRKTQLEAQINLLSK